MLTQQDKNRIENAIWVLLQYQDEIKEFYKKKGELKSDINLYDMFLDLDIINSYFQDWD